ncbi:MAG: VWA domain-containing protein [Lachnospiraceae bacterium]|nr:VWA domain-containing protein [Lachnospiraceae bacterium]
MKRKTILSLLMAAVLSAGVFQTTALAADVDGSKTASPTELTSDSRRTEVTLSLPSAEYHDEYDIVFVMDSSTSTKNSDLHFDENVRGLLESLSEHDATINVAVVKFCGRAFDTIDLASGGAQSGLVEYSESTLDAILAGVNFPEASMKELSRGSNMHGGLDMANDLLAADTDVENSHKFVIVLTDGKNYIWNNGDDVATSYYTQYYARNRQLQNGGKASLNQATGGDTVTPTYRPVQEGVVWYDTYAELFASDNAELTGTSPFEQRCAYAYGEGVPDGTVVTHAATNGAELFSNNGFAAYRNWYEFIPAEAWSGIVWMEANPYELVLDEQGNPVLDDEGRVTFDPNTPNPDFYMYHPNCLLKGLYMAGHLWADMNSRYNCAAVTYNGWSPQAGLAIAKDFCTWLQQNSDYGADVMNSAAVAGIFDTISDEIIYMVNSGTVTDVIPEEFTLVENGTDTFRMTLDGETLPCTADGDAAWNFGTPGEDGAYPYRVEYQADENSFKWIINVPVENSRPVTLTYTLEIAEDAETGEHDTNVSAVLNYMTSNDEPGEYPFPVPVVNYRETFTVTYNDGVDGEEVFADQVYPGIPGGEATPAFDGEPARSGYTFVRWEPEVAETVTADAVYKAVWEPIPTEPESESREETTGPAETETQAPTTPAAPANPSGPSTGDGSNLSLMLSLTVMSGLAVLGVLIYRKARYE